MNYKELKKEYWLKSKQIQKEELAKKLVAAMKRK